MLQHPVPSGPKQMVSEGASDLSLTKQIHQGSPELL